MMLSAIEVLSASSALEGFSKAEYRRALWPAEIGFGRHTLLRAKYWSAARHDRTRQLFRD
jgi:hypothetical protein